MQRMVRKMLEFFTSFACLVGIEACRQSITGRECLLANVKLMRELCEGLSQAQQERCE